MVLDSSAVLAVLFCEPESTALATAIEADATRLISAATVLECEIVARRRSGDAAVEALEALIGEMACEIAPFTAAQFQIARTAFARFGKGLHPANLNFGDCFAYALAKASGEPLLFKGSDFPQTDVRAAQW